MSQFQQTNVGTGFVINSKCRDGDLTSAEIYSSDIAGISISYRYVPISADNGGYRFRHQL